MAADFTIVRVTFTEPVDPVSAQTAGQLPDQRHHHQLRRISKRTIVTVTLTTSSLGHHRPHADRQQREDSRRRYVAHAKRVVHVTAGTIDYDYWLNIGGGTAVSDLTSNPNYPNNPTGHQSLTSFDAPYDWADNYGGRIRGYVLPPTTGYYIFWISSDDNGELWLSTNSNPANKVKIASVPGCDRPQCLERLLAAAIRVDLSGGRAEILHRSPAERRRRRRQPLGGLANAGNHLQHQQRAAHRRPVSCALQLDPLHPALVHDRRQSLGHERHHAGAQRHRERCRPRP